MFDVADARVVTGLSEELLQSRLSLDQGVEAQIRAAVIKQIEGEVDEAAGPALRQRGLKGGEVGRAVLIESAYFAVENAIWKCGRRFRGTWPSSRDLSGSSASPLHRARASGCGIRRI